MISGSHLKRSSAESPNMETWHKTCLPPIRHPCPTKPETLILTTHRQLAKTASSGSGNCCVALLPGR